MKKSDVRGVLRVSVVLAGVVLVGNAASEIGAQEETSTAATRLTELNQSGWVVFLARNKIRPGEATTVVVVPSRRLTLGEFDPEIVPLSDYLKVNAENQSVAGDPKQWTIRAEKSGEYTILVRDKRNVRGRDHDMEQLWQRRLRLTVIEEGKGILSGNVGVIIGAALAVMSSFATSLFKDWREERFRTRDEVRWLSNELVGRLEAARLNVGARLPVDLGAWVDEMYSKYFSALRKRDGFLPTEASISKKLIQIDGMLRQYNESLGRVSVDENLVKSIDQSIAYVVERLSH